MYFHYVIRSHYGSAPFSEREACLSFWKLLKSYYPRSIAAVLMPNHAHWIAPESPETRRGFQKTVSHYEKKYQCQFEPIPEPKSIPDLKHLIRTIRYIHLNPCRSGLVADPLLWEWSTHYDYLGLTLNPWCNLSEFNSLTQSRFNAERFHSYVSSDPTVKVTGSKAIVLQREQVRATATFEDICRSLVFIHRTAALGLHKKQGLRRTAITLGKWFKFNSTQMSEVLGISIRSVNRALECSDLENKSFNNLLVLIHSLLSDIRSLMVIRTISLAHESTRKRTILRLHDSVRSESSLPRTIL